MDFSYDAHIAGPRDRVLELIRDRLADLVPYLPTVDHIEEVSREVDGHKIKITNAWQGNRRALPLFAKPFATKAMTSWQDHALWDGEAYTVEWRFEPNSFKNLYECSGFNTLTERDGGAVTQLRIQGTLVINPERLPVPSGLARRLAPRLEKWAIGRVEPNLAEVPKAVQAFFRQAGA